MIAYRYIHNDGSGLMNNSSLNYDKLKDEEYFDVEDSYLSLRQPPSSLHDKKIIFAFTTEGVEKHKKLIKLLVKASKYGVKKQKINLYNYEIVWDSGDGQLGLIKKKSFKEWLKLLEVGTTSSTPSGGVGDIAPFKRPIGFGLVRRKWPVEKKEKPS